jgi:hypothetical protein
MYIEASESNETCERSLQRAEPVHAQVKLGQGGTVAEPFGDCGKPIAAEA